MPTGDNSGAPEAVGETANAASASPPLKGLTTLRADAIPTLDRPALDALDLVSSALSLWEPRDGRPLWHNQAAAMLFDSLMPGAGAMLANGQAPSEHCSNTIRSYYPVVAAEGPRTALISFGDAADAPHLRCRLTLVNFDREAALLVESAVQPGLATTKSGETGGGDRPDFEQLVKMAAGWVWMTGPDRRFTYFSREVGPGLNAPAEYFLGKTPDQIMDLPAAGERAMRIGRLVADRQSFQGIVVPIVLPDGERRQIRVSGWPRIEAGGIFAGHIGVIEDVTDAVNAQAAVSCLADQLNEAIESFPDGFIYYDRDDRMQLWNRRAAEIYSGFDGRAKVGLPFEKLIEAPVWSGFHTRVAGQEARWLEKRLAYHRNPVGEFVHELADGRWLRIVERRTADGGTTSVHSDITGWKHREQELAALAERNALLAAVIESTATGIAICDAVRDDLPLIYVNPGFAAMTGYAADEIVGRNCRFLQGPDTDPHAVEEIRDAIKARARHSVEMLNYRKSGEPFWNQLTVFPVFDHEGALKMFVGTQIDVSRRHAAEQTAREHQQRFQRIADIAKVAILAFDANGRIVMVNRGAEAMFGYEAGALDGQMLNTLIPGQLPARQQQLLADPAAGVPEEVADQVSDCVGVRREGSEFPVDLTIFTWEMGGQRIGGAVARDTSERKRFEAERASLREQFLQAQKLEALATLAGGVAHNFNNLLGVIIGRADLARMAVPNGSPVGEDLDEIMVAGRRGADLVRQLLDFGRPSTARWERISLGKLLRETAGLLEINLAAGINFTLEGDTQALDVQGDPSQLQQVIMNFCVNAQHAIRRGAGNVQVRLDAVEIAPERVVAIGNWPRAGTPPVPTRLDALAEGRGGRLWLGLLAAGGHARISVTDDGSGMDREVLARVFDPFFTTKPIGQGTGLGLSAVRGIALVHGGALAIETEQGKGSRFEMYLPICK